MIEEQDTQTEEQPPVKVSVKDFAAKVKAKYPEYKDIEDTLLTQKIIDKHPEYKDQVDFGSVEKKNLGTASSKGGVTPSGNGLSPTPKDEPIPYDKKIFTGGIDIQQPKSEAPTKGFVNSDEWRKQMIDHIERQSIATGKIPSFNDYYGDNKPISDATKVAPKPILQSHEEIANLNKVHAENNKKVVDKAFDNTAKKLVAQTRKATLKEGEVPDDMSTFMEINKEKNRLKKSFEDGEVSVAVDPKTGEPGLKQNIGWLESLKKGWNAAVDNNDLAEKFSNADAQGKLDLLKEQQAKNEHPEYIGTKSSDLGSVLEFAASQAPFMGKAIAGATLGAVAAAAAPETGGLSLEGLPTALGFLYTASDAMNNGYMTETMRRFDYLKKQNPNASDVDIMKQASQGGFTGALSGLATNALLMGGGMKMPVSLEGKNVINKSILKTLGSGAYMGATTGGVEGLKLLEGNLEGIKTTPEEFAKSVAKVTGENATIGSLLHVVTGIATGSIKGVPKVLRSALKFGLKDVPKEQISAVLKMNEDEGTIPKGTAEKVTNEIENYKAASDKVAPDLPPEAHAAVAGLIEAKTKLAEEAKTKDNSEATQDYYKGKIAEIDEKIKGIMKTGKPYAYETNAVGDKYTVPEGISVQPPMNVPEPVTVNGETKIPEGITVEKPMQVPEPVTIGGEKSTETKEPSFILTNEEYENKKADIEKRRKEELDSVFQISPIEVRDEKGNLIHTTDKKVAINDKYDAELAELEKQKPINEEAKAAEVPIAETQADTTVEEPVKNIPTAEEGTGGGEPPKIAADGNIIPNTGDIKGITIAANEERRQAIGMSPREKTTESFDQWDAEAIRQINEGKADINQIISKMEKGEATNPVENSIRKIYAATLDKAVDENPTNEILKQAKRYAEAEAKANAAAGRDLVSLKGNGTPRDTLKDFMVAKMQAARVDELTEAQKAEVKLDYEKVKKDRDEFEAKWKQAEEAFRKSEAEKELLSKPKEGSTKTKKIVVNGKRDFKAERESLKEKLKKQVEEYKAAGQKLGLAADGGAESFVISTKIAKTITDIARSHVDEIGVKIKEVVEKTLADVKDFFGDKISEDDIMDVLAGKYNEKKQTQSELTAKMRELNTEAKLLKEYQRLLEGGEPNTETKKQARNKRLAELRKEIKGLEEIDKEVKSVQDAELQKRIDKNKEIVNEIDKVEKEDKVKAAKERRLAQIEAAKELSRLKAEFEKKVRDNARKNKQDAADLVKELKRQSDEKKKQEEIDKREFEKEKRKEEADRIQAQIDATKELERQLNYKTPAERIASQAIERNRRLEQKIRERIANKDFEPKPKAKSFMESPEFKQRHPDLYNAVLDSYNKKDEAQLEFERKLVEEEMKHWGKGDWIKAGIKKTSGTIKHLFASFDASAIAVQNLPLIINNPKLGGEGIVHSFKHFGSEKDFTRWLAELHTSPDWHLIKDSGLRVTEPKSLLESGREEYFPDRFKAVVKIKGKEYGWIKSKDGTKYELLDISKPFERQFTSLSNVLRVTKFREEASKLYDDGFTFENNPEEFTTLAKRINNLSSSADIPQAFQNEITRTFIWSTRLIAAKLNSLGISDVAAAIPGTGVKKGYYRSLGIKGQKISRQQAEAVKDLAGFAVAVLSTSYLYALATHGKVNMNPSSNGFMDVEYGDGKSMNFSGGYSRYISLLTQMARGGKSDKLGVFKPYQGTDRVKEATSFVAGKAPPLTRAALDIAAGKDPGGKEADIATEAAKFKMPLAVGQIYDQIQKDGYGALFNEGLLTFIGFNSKDDRDYKRHVFSSPVKDFIAEHQIPISFPDNKYIKDGVPEKMPDEDYKKYVELRDKIVEDGIKQIMEKSLTKPESEQPDYKKAVGELQSIANEQAKHHLFGEQIKAPEKPVFIKNYKPFKIED